MPKCGILRVKSSIKPPMRRFVLLFSIFITLFVLPAHCLATEFSVEEVLLKAQQEDKHIFMRFTASWCLPCQMLEEELKNHKNIVEDINEIYLYLELDYDKSDHQEWFVRYGVSCLPSMLIIDDMGQVIDRIDGTITIENGLASFLNSNAKYPTDKFEYDVLSQTIEKEVIRSKDPVKTVPIKSVLVNLDYSIQFGAFGSYSNAQKLSNSLLSNENISTIIVEENSNGKTLFKVRQIYFSNTQSGTAYMKEYRSRGIECMLKRA